MEQFSGKALEIFFNLERSNFNRKTLHRIRIKNEETTDPIRIRNHITAYYKDLYTSKRESDDESQEHYLENIAIPKLSQELKDELDKEVTLVEISKALKDLKSNKVAGVDGLPPEFYKVFWLRLKHFFFELIDEIIRFTT